MDFDPDVAFDRLTNPRMTTGLRVLDTLLTLSTLQGGLVEPKDVRKTVDSVISKRKVSKQSITNAAIRLEESNIIDRKENKYAVNYGHLVSILLHKVLKMNEKIINLEEQLQSMKANN